MRDRAELLVGRRVRAMWVMTFHAACARMLRAHADRLGYTRQVDDLRLRPTRDGCQALPRGAGDRPQALYAAAILQPDLRRQEPAPGCRRVRADGRAPISSRRSPTFFADYEPELHRMNAMDFDDLLARAVDVLQLFQEIRDQLRLPASATCSFNEYQDTNHAQYRWLQLLAEERRSLMVVGDPRSVLGGGNTR